MANTSEDEEYMIGPSVLLAIFPYAFIAFFPLLGVAIVTKWELEARRKRKSLKH